MSNKEINWISECVVLPYFKSPNMANFVPSTLPLLSIIVNTSNNACVGCSAFPLPAFIIGTLETLSATIAASSKEWRITMASAYLSNALIVSSKLSPFVDEEFAFPFSVTIILPPNLWIAASKDILVLVLGSKNITATSLFFNSSV